MENIKHILEVVIAKYAIAGQVLVAASVPVLHDLNQRYAEMC
jgi:hypothetical protein